MGIAVGIALLSSVLETEVISFCRIYFRFKATILNFPLSFMRESVQENMIEFAVSQSNRNVAYGWYMKYMFCKA